MSWCPNSSIALIAAAVDQYVYLINPGVGDRLVQAKTDEILKEMPDQTDNMSSCLFFVVVVLTHSDSFVIGVFVLFVQSRLVSERF